MIIVSLPANQHANFSDVWGPDQQDALSAMAANFKKADDLIGVYLCAIVEEQLSAIDKHQSSCPVEVQFFLAMAVARETGALHDLVHVIYPEIGEVFAAAAAASGRAEQNPV